ncbi:MAG: GNAT family N-acetyltransferase [Xanthobacteraceae bacterium]
MEIRDAVAEDAPAACDVIRRSIAELCAADHRDDPEILGNWLRNKTPEIVGAWIGQPTSSILVAVERGLILAVGGITDGGYITLNYVSPDARFRGVSKALLVALERRAIARGNAQCTLHSTTTAHRFYLATGYADDGPSGHKFSIPSQPMRKVLAGDGA